MELEQVNGTTPVEHTGELNKTEQVKADPYEDQAREMGWRPQDEWEGEPEKWRGAKEFVERGELYGKIDTVSRELKETRKALKMLQEHHSKVREAEYNRAVEELKAAQKKHLEDGNADEYIKTTELLTDLKAEQKAREVVKEVTPKEQGTLDPRFIEWQKENSWYERNSEMRDFADTIGQGYASRNPGVNPVEVLKYVTREIKKHYKEQFENPNRSKPNAVESGSKQTSGKKPSYELTDEERKVMNAFIRQGVIGEGGMTKEEYIEQVKLSKGIK